MTVTIDQIDATEELLELVQEKVWLVSLYVGWPKLSYQIEEADVTVDTDEAGTVKIDEKFRTAPQWALIPQEWKTQLTRIETAARQALSRASIRFGQKGTALLPITRTQAVFSELRRHREEFNRIADEFSARYGEVLAWLRQELDAALYEKAAKKLPNRDEVRDKFRMSWAIIPLASSGGPPARYWQELTQAVERLATKLDSSYSDDVQAIYDHIARHHDAALSRMTEDEANDLVREARQELHKLVQQSVADMINEPRRQIVLACENMLNAISNERVIKAGTIRQIKQAFENLQGFSFLADDTLLEKIRAVQDRLNVEPRTLNQDRDVSLALANALRPVIDAANDAAAASRQLRKFRAVRVK